MSILLDKDSRVIVQGITGNNGSFHARQMMEYGTRLVGGVTPGKGGQKFDDQIPIFHSVAEATQATNADVSAIFVPAPFCADAICEAAAAGVQLIVTITEGIPVLDMVKALRFVEECGARVIGPNCPGIISPGQSKVGIMPGSIHKQGKVGVISRSGTLTYEAVAQLTELELGQTTCVGIGGDPLIGTVFTDLLELFEQDPDTEAVVMIGEIGGNAEELAAAYIADNMKKPVVSFIAGQTAPPGKRMGHAGAIISGGSGTAASKMDALQEAGVKTVRRLTDIGQAVKELLA